MNLDVDTVVFLRRPADAPEPSDPELDAFQEEHVAFNARMRAEGHAILTGPRRGQPDETLRGINVFRTSTDAGHLAFDLCTWPLPEGTLGDRPADRISVD